MICGCPAPKQTIKLDRDNYLTGGALTFYYDELSSTAFFGEENEVIQFYEEDISKGFDKEGNRVGIKIVPEKHIDDLGSVTIKISKEEISGTDASVKINDNLVYFQIFPIVKEAGQTIPVDIEYKNQKYKFYIKIHEKVLLMDKNT